MQNKCLKLIQYVNPKKDVLTCVISLLIILILLFIPTGIPADYYPDSYRACALVTDTNDSMPYSTGIILQGEQVCTLRILNGAFKGQEIQGVNRLMGKLEFDKVFSKGDRALVVLNTQGGKIIFANIIDHYRIDIEAILFMAFVLLLLIFAGWVGAKVLFSFIITVLMIWKILIPSLLKGWNPIITALAVVMLLTLIIITLVGGLNKKSFVAILGSLSGTILTCILAMVFGCFFKIHGAVMPFSETLLYSGYPHLRITEIFIAAIFIASSGALMDLAMDISAAVSELVEKNPLITQREAIMSGFNIGRAVIGTMTTTLLLAYSGGYMALMMVFMAQGTPVANILNLKYVAAEILHTIVGSFGLVTVAPFTAIVAGIVFTKPSCAAHL